LIADAPLGNPSLAKGFELEGSKLGGPLTSKPPDERVECSAEKAVFPVSSKSLVVTLCKRQIPFHELGIAKIGVVAVESAAIGQPEADEAVVFEMGFLKAPWATVAIATGQAHDTLAARLVMREFRDS
jgi:hypothetical protein